MYARRLRRAGAVLIGALAACALLAAPASAATSHTFRVDLLFEQSAEWEHQVQYPYDPVCGSNAVRWIYKGSGFAGPLRGQLRAGRVTFRDVGGSRFIQSSEVRVPAYIDASAAQYSVEQVGTIPPNCTVPAHYPLSVSTRGCNVRINGRIRVHLLVIGGRMQATGGFYPTRAGTPLCPDPTVYSGAVSHAGRLPRSDLHTLIHNRRVRSIQLTTGRRIRQLGPTTIANFGANTRTLSASGRGWARWSIKLTRIN